VDSLRHILRVSPRRSPLSNQQVDLRVSPS
jgi:hypothetical protein